MVLRTVPALVIGCATANGREESLAAAMPVNSQTLAAIADPSPLLVGLALLGLGAYFRRR